MEVIVHVLVCMIILLCIPRYLENPGISLMRVTDCTPSGIFVFRSTRDNPGMSLRVTDCMVLILEYLYTRIPGSIPGCF